MSTSTSVPRVLFTVGAVGVGKSDASYRLFARLWRKGVQTARLDLDELGMCHPAPPQDPDNHQVKAAVLGAAWPVFRDRDTSRLVLAGSAGNRDELDLYRAQVPDAEWTVCRLRVTAQVRDSRIDRRSQMLGSSAAESAFWAEVGQTEDAALDTASVADHVVDTDGRDREGVVDLILEATRWHAPDDSVVSR